MARRGRGEDESGSRVAPARDTGTTAGSGSGTAAAGSSAGRGSTVGGPSGQGTTAGRSVGSSPTVRGSGGSAPTAGGSAGSAPTAGGSAGSAPTTGGRVDETTTAGPGAASPAARSRLGWVALTVAAVLLVWQAVYALTVAGPGLDGREVYTSAWLLVSLVLAVGAAVLGIVAASQRVTPRWPATTALAVGTYVFLVCVATWAGSIITMS